MYESRLAAQVKAFEADLRAKASEASVLAAKVERLEQTGSKVCGAGMP